MFTKEAFKEFYRKRNPRGRALERDTLIVQSFFGLGTQAAPTHRSVAREFGVSHERVRQIVENNFIEKMREEDKDGLYRIQALLERNTIFWWKDFHDRMVVEGLSETVLYVQGFMHLLRAFGIGEDYGLYTTELAAAGRAVGESALLLAKREAIEEKLGMFSRLKSIPSRNGICELGEVFEKEGFDTRHLPFFQELLTQYPMCWFKEREGGLWYLFENRENILFNTLSKTSMVADKVALPTLSAVLSRCITRRTNDYNAPSIELIFDYLKDSRYTKMEGDMVSLLVEKGELTEIEKDIQRFFIESGETKASYTLLHSYLMELGHLDANVVKSVFHSPILHIDHSRGLRRYRFSLLENVTSDSYDHISGLLNDLSGTDYDGEVKKRKEQKILRDWLFKGKETESCAICGKTYHVRSLVCAHKKKRSLCTEIERTDPHIVMPLCLFGCDVMYEQEFLEIADGEVRGYPDGLTEQEKNYITRLIGRKVDSRWLQGSPFYFAREEEPVDVELEEEAIN
ncbi:hypothetical protein V7201_23090 [Bacillus sp. JJ1122]|uniref:hypothetical protein n=1 Tax=Bacillus sp. JJ1122 TaxID=3122951 RepID=UPI002FFE6993